MTTTYYAISDLGYGRDDTLAKAVINHYETLLDLRPSGMQKEVWADKVREIQPAMLRAPEGATGFVLHGGPGVGWGSVRWTREDGSFLRASDERDWIHA